MFRERVFQTPSPAQEAFDVPLSIPFRTAQAPLHAAVFFNAVFYEIARAREFNERVGVTIRPRQSLRRAYYIEIRPRPFREREELF
jgi:hypothetical protein